MKCSICQNEIQPVGDWTQGNNAEPVNDGRCCDQCNATVVIPARLTQMRQRIPPVVAKTHTPGPWKVGGVDDLCVTPSDSTDERICVCWDPRPTEIEDGGLENHDDEIRANARLIAAAPELLAALKVAVKVMQDNDLDESMAGEFEIFTDAINKAEGRGE